MLLLYSLAVLFGLLSVCLAWLVARALAWPRDGVAYGKFVGSLAGAAALAAGLPAFAMAAMTGNKTFGWALTIIVIVGAAVASIHGERAGEQRAAAKKK